MAPRTTAQGPGPRTPTPHKSTNPHDPRFRAHGSRTAGQGSGILAGGLVGKALGDCVENFPSQPCQEGRLPRRDQLCTVSWAWPDGRGETKCPILGGSRLA